MKRKPNIAKINGKEVDGEAHLQPGPNQWIGVFHVARNLLGEEIDQGKAVIVSYEGPFKCKNACIHGKSKAKITHIRIEKGSLIINLEGIEKPAPEKESCDDPQFDYIKKLQDGYL